MIQINARTPRRVAAGDPRVCVSSAVGGDPRRIRPVARSYIIHKIKRATIG